MPVVPQGEPYDVNVVALGVPVRIRVLGVDAPALATRIAEAWSDCKTQGHLREAVCVEVQLSDETPADGAVNGSTADEVLHNLSSRITLEAINRRAGELIMLHACGLAHPETGATVALTGPSGTGKTTMARTLGREFAYVTDETVGVRPDLTVEPYFKPLSIIDGGGPYKRQVAASALGLGRVTAPLRLTAVVKLNRDPHWSGSPDVSIPSHVRGVFELGPEVSYVGMGERPLHRLSGLLAATGELRVCTYRDSSELLPFLRQLLDGEA